MNPSTLPPEIQTALDGGGDLHSLLAATIRHFGCQVGTIHLLRDGLLRLESQIGLPPHLVAIVEKVPIGKGIAGLAAERRAPVNICNLQTDDSGQARPAARGTGMEGSIAVPMLSADGALGGVLGVAKAEAHDWTEEETNALLAIGRALAESKGPAGAPKEA